ncbi:cell division cycle protein 123 [Monosporozyma unispora]|nr:hypothetical protein C6P44_003393 [Kazachstania unispora]
MSEYTPLTDITVTRKNIENCSFSQWYPLFKSHTTRSRILKPVPQEFIDYLKQDGIKLPHDTEDNSFYTTGISNNDDNEYSDWEDEDDENADSAKPKVEEGNKTIDPIIHFKDFHTQLKDIIRELGPVTPKLNWSAPRDATWIVPNNSMKCNEVNEIYLLLTASNYIMHDLEHAFDECDVDEADTTQPETELILREWFDVNPALEFRVFVKDGKIIGASQRDLNYYDYLEALSDTFKDLIDEFVEDVVLPKFPDNSFALDVYIPRPFNKVYLIDINPFARKTDPLMFSWNELITEKEPNTNVGEEEDYELRLIKENNTARFACKEHSENQVPRDVVDASLDPNAIRELAQKWKVLLTQQEQESSTDEED